MPLKKLGSTGLQVLKGSTLIVCAECIVPPEVPEKPVPDDLVQCPNCNRSDTVETVLTDARHHATHGAKRNLEQKMEQSGRTLRNRTQTRIPIKRLRWITNQV